MGSKAIKRFLVWLSVAALVGGPWAQVFAQSAAHPCTISISAAAADMASSDPPLCNEIAGHEMDSGKSTSINCTQNCVAPLNLAVSTISLNFEYLTPAFEPAISVAKDGRIPEPELFPPIDHI